MENFNLDSLNELQIDMLREIANIGMGNLATSLSNMLNQKIDVAIPNVDVLDVCDVCNKLGGEEKRVAGIMFGMSGDIEGSMLFILEERFAIDMIKTLFTDDASDLSIDRLNEEDASVLTEVANVMAGTYLNALSQLTDFTITMSIPYLMVDMLGALMNLPVTQFGLVGDKVLLMQENILGNHNYFDSFLLLTPTVESLEKIITKVGSIYGQNS